MQNGEYSRYGKIEFRRLIIKFVHFMAKNQYTSTKYQLIPMTKIVISPIGFSYWHMVFTLTSYN